MLETRSLGQLIESGIIDATNGFPFGGHSSDGSGIPHIRPFNVATNGEITLEQIKSIPLEATSGKPRLRRGDVLFNNTNTKELVGKCAVWDQETEPVFSNHMTRIRVREDACDAAYLSFAILHHWILGKSEMLARAHVAQASIMGERFREIEVPWRRLSEQRAIATMIARVRDARRLDLVQEDRTQRLKRAVMNDLFTRGLRSGAQTETEFGLVPTAWENAPLESVATIQTGVAKGRKFAEAEMIEVPYLRVANVQDGHLDLSEMKTIPIRRSDVDRYRLQNGDVVLTEGGDFDKLGRGFIWRGELELCVHQNHVFAVRTEKARLLPDFFAYLAQSPYGKAYFLQVAHKTTNLACINTTKLKAFPVLLPSLDEQREIVSILDALDRKIDLHRKKRDVLEEIFKSLLHKLMTSEVHVEEMDLPSLAATPIAEVAA